MPNPGMPFPLHPDLPPLPQDNPAGQTAESATPADAPPESTSGKEPRRYAGKYGTVEELEAAYNSSFSELDRIRDEARLEIDRERARIDALILQQRQPALPAEKDPLDDLQTYGVPPNLIRDAIRAEATRIARAEVGQALAPMTSANQARAAVSRQYQDFATLEQTVADFVGADRSLTERYGRLFKEDPQGAMEWAYLRYRETHPPKQPQRKTAAADPSDGGLPTTAGASERSQNNAETAQAEELSKAREYYKQFKDPMPYVRARLRSLIPDSHFAQG